MSNIGQEISKLVIYLVLLSQVMRRLKKNEKILKKRKGFRKVPGWMFKLTFWNSLGGIFYFTFLCVAGVFATVYTAKGLKPILPQGYFTNDFPILMLQLGEISVLLWLAFLLGRRFWNTWSGFKLVLFDFIAFTYYVGLVVLLTVAFFNFTEGLMAAYAAAGPVWNVLVSLLVLLAECALVAWLAYEGWLRIWSTIQEKQKTVR